VWTLAYPKWTRRIFTKPAKSPAVTFCDGTATTSIAVQVPVSEPLCPHPGPEIFYLLTGEQCLETPNGALRARAGEGMVAPANTPMQLNIMGSSKRDAFFAVVHDSTKPRATLSDWRPKGTCKD